MPKVSKDKEVHDNKASVLRPRLIILVAVTVLGGIFVYGTSLSGVINAVFHRQGSSHGIFIPFISGYFIWMKRASFRKIEYQFNVFGIPLLLIGLALPVLGIGGFQLQAISFFFFVGGMVLMLLGGRFFKEISFPLFFLITMVPIPQDSYISLANYVRDITFGGAALVTSLFGIPYLKEGCFMHLPDTVLRINIGCSGIRYLVSYFVFGLAYAYLTRKTTINRLIVVVLTLPISIIASICRLTAIFILAYAVSPRMASYWPHVIISWSVFFAVLILAIGLDQFFQARVTSSA